VVRSRSDNEKRIEKSKSMNLRNSISRERSETICDIPGLVVENNKIIGGTVVSLLDYMIGPEYNEVETNFIEVMCVTHHYFIESATLLREMLRRYSRFKFNLSTQFRVVNILMFWIQYLYLDFKENVIWNSMFEAFLESLKNGKLNEKKWYEMLMNKLNSKTMTNSNEEVKVENETTDNSEKNEVILDVLEIDSILLANFLTITESNFLTNIKLEEYSMKSWDTKTNTNLSDYIARFNRVSFWVASEILIREYVKERSLVILKFLEVMEILLQLKNYNVLMQIFTALNFLPITRLRKTWKLVPTKYTAIFETVKEFMEPNGFLYPNYRKILEDISKDDSMAIPYQPLILSDLTRIEEFPTFHEEEVVNWTKMESLATVFSLLLKFRNGQNYKFKVDIRIQTFFESSQILNEEELMAASNNLEPDKPEKNRKKKKNFSNTK